MLGSLSLGMNLMEKSDAQLEELAEIIRLYKELAPTIQHGDLYRLVSIYGDEMSAYEYASVDGGEAVVFTFGKSMQFRRPLPRIRLKGLLPDTLYTVNGGNAVSGRGLMAIGIEPELIGDFDSRMYQIKHI